LINQQHSLSAEIASFLCSRYGLGVPTAAPDPVFGGLIHRVFHLTTTKGIFAVKVLDRNIMQRSGVREEFRRSERIAAAFAAADVPAVLALEAPGGIVQDIGAVTVMAYPWCDGKVLPKSTASPYQACQVGALLGRMHALNLRLPGEKATSISDRRDPIPVQDWEKLVHRAEDQGVVWATAMRAALPSLFLWDRMGIEAEQLLPQTLVISHCDLDQKNVLWRDGNMPVLIDWESVGPTQPVAELIGAALDWNGQSVGPPERTAFAAVIKGYRQEAEFSAALVLPALRCRLAGWIGWLGANMHRSLGSGASSQEMDLGVWETTKTLSTMYRLASGMETWAEWCDG